MISGILIDLLSQNFM